MKFFLVLVATSLLGLVSCDDQYHRDHDCPEIQPVRAFSGEIVLDRGGRHPATEYLSGPEADFQFRYPRRWDARIWLDDPCPDTDDGCVRLGDSWDHGLTFRRPTEARTYRLRALDAKVCWGQDEPPKRLATLCDAAPADPRCEFSYKVHCTDLDGDLVVREVIAPLHEGTEPAKSGRFDADIAIDPLDPAAQPAAHGASQVLFTNDEVHSACGETNWNFHWSP
jgi:hypothetical protein